jgi:hypothetical protein
VIRCTGYQVEWCKRVMGQWGNGNLVTAQLETAYIHPHNKLGSVSSFDLEGFSPFSLLQFTQWSVPGTCQCAACP